MLRIPPPPSNLPPEVYDYLDRLVDALDQILSEHDSSMQRKGDPVTVPITTVAQVTAAPATYRPGQEGRIILVADAQAGAGSLGVSFDANDGQGPQFKELPLGPEVA